MRALILGSSGRLGRYLTQHIQSLGVEVDTPTIRISNGLQVQNFLSLENYQVVFNCIGLVGVEICETNQDTAILLNRDLPTLLSKEALKYDYKFVQFSTPSVFSGENAPNIESDVPDSPSINGRINFREKRELWVQTLRRWLYDSISLGFIRAKIHWQCRYSKMLDMGWGSKLLTTCGLIQCMHYMQQRCR